MITIAGDRIDINKLSHNYKNNSIEKYILDILSSSSHIYNYNSERELKFELNLRKNIVNASISLYRSNFGFSIFRKSRCNTDYWERTRQGGFLLKEGAKPSSAIDDIFTNGDEYATECATAMVIVYYKACLDSLGSKIFNNTFPKIYLMNWHNVDKNLGLTTVDNAADNIPGDCRYFQNPDVNPLTPEWQGENVIYLGDDMYYGHGVGIKNGDEIINTLNKTRIAGSSRSAHLLPSATRPDFEKLSRLK
ncbi:protein-glutamine gamma-glutamyltransferase [Clostridium tyrobutyricum]|uniref:protein-glutamine gamma-glutamyltransferase n=1 Tax=Clostridium tyrobutyricum TaxID=1519 RepID=UPI001C38CD2A|nr:protein-glutamine gamma-glutamyltransferase [Clostridium tyrobutyricum]MBV4418433.1 protein-glutamine gamma-glutamyltransferase [Clostridium tyrobutyricum]